MTLDRYLKGMGFSILVYYGADGKGFYAELRDSNFKPLIHVVGDNAGEAIEDLILEATVKYGGKDETARRNQ